MSHRQMEYAKVQHDASSPVLVREESGTNIEIKRVCRFLNTF